MKKEYGKKSMSLGDLTMYLEDLVRMGFVHRQINEDGKLKYKLTELGQKSGLEEQPN
jgi:DNA-binding HxlR family transcriptional regulator